MAHAYYPQRTGLNPNPKGLPLEDLVGLVVRIYDQFRAEGYFDEAFGFTCVDSGDCPGKLQDVNLEILLSIRKKNLWPINEASAGYSEDDLFDMIEFLYQHVSKPVHGNYHSWNDCGMHWETFNQNDGRREYCDKVNAALCQYEKPFELTPTGEVLQKPEAGFEAIFTADIPSKDRNVVDRMNAAVVRFRRHGSTLDDRRQAVRDLADVLEYLRPKVQRVLTSNDEKDLFNIANNFGIRHHNEKQKTNYDAALWLSWMFYFFLSTVHVLLRKLEHNVNNNKQCSPAQPLLSTATRSSKRR